MYTYLHVITLSDFPFGKAEHAILYKTTRRNAT